MQLITTEGSSPCTLHSRSHLSIALCILFTAALQWILHLTSSLSRSSQTSSMRRHWMSGSLTRAGFLG